MSTPNITNLISQDTILNVEFNDHLDSLKRIKISAHCSTINGLTQNDIIQLIRCWWTGFIHLVAVTISVGKNDLQLQFSGYRYFYMLLIPYCYEIFHAYKNYNLYKAHI